MSLSELSEELPLGLDGSVVDQLGIKYRVHFGFANLRDCLHALELRCRCCVDFKVEFRLDFAFAGFMSFASFVFFVFFVFFALVLFYLFIQLRFVFAGFVLLAD